MQPRESITYLGHATVRFDLGGARLLSDPVLRDHIGHLRRRSPSLPNEAYARLDGVLLSHLHRDHVDMASLRRLPRDVPIVVPRGGGRLLTDFAAVHEVVVGDEVQLGGVEVTAVRAEHPGRRRPLFGGADAAAIGYVLAGASRVYFAGDTDLYPEMAALQPLDVALLPVWGWGPNLGPGHMDPEAAALALSLLRPRIAVPIHWGTLYPVAARPRDRLTSPPLEFAEHAGLLAPDVHVEILQPGSTLELQSAAA
jgi:L-ascorbate metabolism protein UlaG (beta-lactamase superfamily)